MHHCVHHTSAHLFAGTLKTTPDTAGVDGGGGVAVEQKWEGLVLSETGNYKVCWCPIQGSDCNAADKFNVQVAADTFGVNGPNTIPSGVTCTLTESCSVQLTGFDTGGLASSNKLMIIEDSTECGDASAVAADFDGATNPKEASGADNDTYDFSTPTEGPAGTYKLCWGHSPGTDVTDFAVPIATFTLSGADAGQDIVCTLSLPCNVQITGTALSAATNKMMVVDGACEASPEAASFTGVSQDSGVLVTNSGGFDTYAFGTPTTGTPKEDYNPCWAHNNDFSLDAGTFKLHGPDPDQDLECMLTVSCVLTVSGVGLGDGNKLQILPNSENCDNSQIGLSPFTSSNGISNGNSVVSSGANFDEFKFDIISTGAAGTDHRLCWAAVDVYSIDIGTFTLKGPDMNQDVDCTLGISLIMITPLTCALLFGGINITHSGSQVSGSNVTMS